MVVDAIFDFAKAYDIERLDVAQGQSFKLVISNYSEPIKLFADNDEVLSSRIVGNEISLTADSKGTSTLIIMSEAFQPIKTLTVSVVDAIISQATDLGLSADQPADKADKE